MLSWLIPLPLLAALVIAVVGPRRPRVAGWLGGLASSAACVWLLTDLPGSGEVRRVGFDWVPALGVRLSLALDGLSATFAALVLGVGGTVLVYTIGYACPRGVELTEARARKASRLLVLLLLFQTAMLGLVLADDPITLFVFWELTGVVSFLLISTGGDEAARRAARKALLVTCGGGLALLAGLVLLALAASEAGARTVSLTGMAGLELRDHPLYLPMFWLICAGAFTKSAQLPFHGWLPGAMAAPTPVSAYLHSATMVKAGVYLLARLHPVLGGTLAWEFTLGLFGGTTFLVAAWLSVRQRDLKRILAFSTVAVLGALVMLLGVGTVPAIEAAIVFAVGHALYKAALFMVAGIVDQATGTRDIRSLGGLARAMPLTAAAGLLAAASKAGTPPLFGFHGKELFYKAKLDLETLGGALIVVAVVGNLLLVAAAFLVAVKPFFGRLRTPAAQAGRVGAALLFGPLLLSAAGLFVGLFPGAFDHHLGTPMATAIAGRPVAMKLKLWHGLSIEALTVLGASILTLLLGGVGYLRVRARRRRADRPTPPAVSGVLFELGRTLAVATDRWLSGGAFRRHATRCLAAAVLLAVMAAWSAPGVSIDGPPLGLLDGVGVLLIWIGAATAVVSWSRTAAVMGLGAAGLGMTLTFVAYGGPDLAMTQLAVESLMVVVLLLVLRGLPKLDPQRPEHRVRDVFLAVAVGLVMTWLTLSALSTPGPRDLSTRHGELALPKAHGRNVVNVVLTDFRALDTLGEIVVVAVAAIGIGSLLRGGGEQ